MSTNLRGYADSYQTLAAGASLQIAPIVEDQPQSQFVVSNLQPAYQFTTDPVTHDVTAIPTVPEDYVLVICDTQGRMVCPVWPQHSISFECDGPFRLKNFGSEEVPFCVGQVLLRSGSGSVGGGSGLPGGAISGGAPLERTPTFRGGNVTNSGFRTPKIP